MVTTVSTYLDCNATTPLEPKVSEIISYYFNQEYGNPGSRTHNYGSRAKQAVHNARDQIASVVNVSREEVLFTSGATESNNLSILGLQDFAQAEGKTHFICSKIEHKAVIEPFEYLESRGFEVSWLTPNEAGVVDPVVLEESLRSNTCLVSLMHVNNETGIIQPLEQYVEVMKSHPCFFHVDAAQSFGKLIEPLQNPRIDLTSISGHKIYGPKGIGALIARRRQHKRPPIKPLMYGGGQERGLRPGTLAVPLIAGLGQAAELAEKNWDFRTQKNRAFREKFLNKINVLEPQFNGNLDKMITHTLNFTIPGLDSEAVILMLKDIVSISNGSACTSHSYEPSHVLKAMGLDDERIEGALRVSWCHMTEEPDWDALISTLMMLK